MATEETRVTARAAAPARPPTNTSASKATKSTPTTIARPRSPLYSSYSYASSPPQTRSGSRRYSPRASSPPRVPPESAGSARSPRQQQHRQRPRRLASDAEQRRHRLASASASVSASVLVSRGPARTSYSITGDEPWISPEQLQDLRYLWDQQDPHNTMDEKLRLPAFRKLPAGCKLGVLVGEGAANVVFEFFLPDGSFMRHRNSRLLLRVAKAPIDGDRPVFDYVVQQRYYQDCIRPILSDHVLHQELVVLRGSGITDAINEHLASINSSRREKFKGSWVASSNWAFLVEDMRVHDAEKALLLEFKPKWLTQSPSAPKNAIRCRQCAKELHDFVTKPHLGRPAPGDEKLCPLELAKAGDSHIRAELRHFLPPNARGIPDDHHPIPTMLSSLANDGALKALKRAQEENDQVGPLKAGKKDYKFALAMTLRDCSCFAQVERRSLLDDKNIIPLKVRISDLDMKSLKYKLEYWRKTEEELIDQGFYTADWLLVGSDYYHPPTSCSLEWSVDRRYRKPDIIHVRDGERSNDVQPAGMRKSLAALEQESKLFHLDGNTQLLQKCLEPFKKDVTAQKRPEIACINPERSQPMPLHV